ncbi:MAG: hypothetical protein IJ566_02280 [Cardiobacteriaceae bacterium]|nr:hypothetical protein [Cardiobacteriaceae bacterium]
MKILPFLSRQHNRPFIRIVRLIDNIQKVFDENNVSAETYYQKQLSGLKNQLTKGNYENLNYWLINIYRPLIDDGMYEKVSNELNLLETELSKISR